MNDLDELFNLADAHQSRGELADAETIYHRILAQHPDHPDALNLLGVIAARRGETRQALNLFLRATQLEPRAPMYFVNLGEAFRTLGAFDQAAAAYGRAAEIAPNDPSALAGLAESLSQLGIALAGQKRFAEALQACRRATEIHPRQPGYWLNLSLVAHQAGDCSIALQAARQAVALAPDSPDAHAQLGAALELNEQCNEAVSEYQRAVELGADDTDWQCINRGVARMRLGRVIEAERDFARAVQLSPANPTAHFNDAVALLTLGIFDRGWLEYEWRPNKPNLARPWTGEAFAPGDSILIVHEQGYGDAIQFIRYASLLAERGARVIVAAPPPLISLLKTAKAVDDVIPLTSNLPPITWQANLLSLPLIFKTNLDSIPRDVPYLYPPAEKVESFRERLKNDPGRLHVGLCWSGNITESFDRSRSIALEKLSSLLEIPDIAWYALQPMTHAHPAIRSLLDFTDFSDTAALIETLDLVISIDTAVAHLSGALGKPTWTLLGFSPDWRWLRDRDDSVWYPTMKLFRQPALGDWPSVVTRIGEELPSLG